MKRFSLLVMSLFALMASAEEVKTQDFVTDTLDNGISCLEYFGCDMFVDRMAFNIISKEDQMVELTNLKPAEMIGDRWIYQMDTMRIPQTVTWRDTVYTVKAIGSWAFTYSEIKHLEIPSTVTEIKEHAFSFIEDLEELIIPENVTTIGNYAFAGNFRQDRSEFPKKITFPETVESWGEGLFYSRKGDYIPLPNYLAAIPSSAYAYGGLTEWPDLSLNVEVISVGAFLGNDFEAIHLPEHLKVIGDYAFYNCNRLKKVTIPESVTLIGENAFGGENDGKSSPCQLEMLRFLSQMPPECKIEWEASNAQNAKTIIVVPDGTKEVYRNAWHLTSTTIIEESEQTAIDGVEDNAHRELGRYALDGRHLMRPEKGINIIRLGKHTIRKKLTK